MRRSVLVLLATASPSLALAASTATITGPTTVPAGSSINLSASASSNNIACGTTVTYTWDLDQDGAYDDASTQAVTFNASAYDGPVARSVAVRAVVQCVGFTEQATDTHAIDVTNVSPNTVAASGPTQVQEGTKADFDVTFVDPEASDTHEYSWDWADGTSKSTTKAASHTWTDDGARTVSITVTDDDGGVGSDTHSVLVTNVAPTITTATWNAIANEGAQVTFSAAATDPGTSDVLTYTWSFGDGTQATGAIVTHAYGDNGAYGVTLQVDDGDQGSDTLASNINILNLDPVVTSMDGPNGGPEGTLLEYEVKFTDGGAKDTHTVTWSWGDGTPNSSGTKASHAFADDGEYPVKVTVCDDDGACDDTTREIVVSNAAPVIGAITGPAAHDEGVAGSYECEATDAGTADTLTYEIDFGDGSAKVATAKADHTYADDGAYTITCTVTDPDGGVDTFEQDIVVDNVAPEITGTPDASVVEGTTFVFTPGVTDTAADTHIWGLQGPDDMTIDGGHKISWSPTYEDVGEHQFTVTVTDDDGGKDTVVYDLTVEMLDADQDSMSDYWESANGLDPANPDDAATDKDGDGRANGQEWDDGTDPQSYDGPSVPTVDSPFDGEELDQGPVELVVNNATSPTDEPLTYYFEVYSDSSMSETALLDASDPILEQEGSRFTSYVFEGTLEENTRYFWRAAAEDPYTMGDWMQPVSFFYNTVNDPPPAPGIRMPIDGATVVDRTPVLEIDEPHDLDEDALTYSFRIEDLDGNPVLGADDVVGDEVTATWTPDTDLDDDKTYCWYAWATDEHGAVGPESETACFTVDTSNAPPSAPVITDPADQAMVSTLTPTITVTNGVDPEARTTFHRFELDTASTFDSLALQTATTGSGETTTSWTPDGALAEDTWYHLRVLATDGAAVSDWDQISFFVNATNGAPSIPGLHNPGDGAAFADGDSLSVVNSTDPEQQTVTYDFVIFDADGVEAQTAQDVAEDASGFTEWVPDALAPGEYTWTARAVDEAGASSEWATARSLEVLGEDDTDDTDDEPDTDGGDTDVEDGKGCNCSAAQGLPLASLAAFLPLAIGLLARRRR